MANALPMNERSENWTLLRIVTSCRDYRGGNCDDQGRVEAGIGLTIPTLRIVSLRLVGEDRQPCSDRATWYRIVTLRGTAPLNILRSLGRLKLRLSFQADHLDHHLYHHGLYRYPLRVLQNPASSAIWRINLVEWLLYFRRGLPRLISQHPYYLRRSSRMTTRSHPHEPTPQHLSSPHVTI